MPRTEVAILDLAEAVVVANFVVLDALWVNGVLSYEETLESVRWVRSETEGRRGAITTQTLLDLERAALDGIRTHSTGTHHKWKPAVIEGDQETPGNSDDNCG
jgi:hypothetical protein